MDIEHIRRDRTRSWAGKPLSRRLVAFFGALLAGATVLSACGGGTSSNGDGSGGGSTLTVAVGNTGTHQWAPHLAGNDTLAMYKFMHDSLTDIDKNTGQVKPMLATSWSLSDDGLTWDFKLRPNVIFQDGWGPLTAEDVKFTYQEWIRPDSNQNDAEQLRAIIGDDLDNIEIVGPLELKIHTVEKFTTLDAFLAQPYTRLFIVSKKYNTEKPDEAVKHPIGTGPWEFVSSTPGVDVVMKKNPDYWGTVPSFDNLVVKEIPDDAARLAQVQSGAVDIANMSAGLTEEATADGLRTISVPEIATEQRGWRYVRRCRSRSTGS
jgi:peptide/nickel transport system substrate-binding protein